MAIATGASISVHALAHAADPPGAAAEYADKLMSGAIGAADVDEEMSPGFDATGAPRMLRIESRVQSLSNGSGRESSAWTGVRAAIDTANYGAFSFEGSARLLEQTSQRRRGPGASFTLYQTAMPFAGGWYATQGMGVIQTLIPTLAAQQTSWLVPTRLVQGASTQWSNASRGLTVQLSGGESGSFSSIGRGSFYGSGDRVAVAGLQLQAGGAATDALMPRGWSYSAMASAASGSGDQVVPGYGLRLGEPSGAGVFQSLRWESDRSFVHGNMLVSRGEGLSTDTWGLSKRPRSSRPAIWLDGDSQSGEATRRWGVHHLPADLSWQGSALGGNSEGGYFRWSQIGLRTQVEAQFAATRRVDRSSDAQAYTQAGVAIRRYVDQELGIGGTLQISRSSTTGIQVSGYSELHRPWADLRVQAGLEFDGGNIVAHRLSIDQAWALPVGQHLATSQALTSSKAAARTATGSTASDDGISVELAVTGGADVTDRLSLDLNMRANLPVSSQAARIYTVNASCGFRLAGGWTLAAALTASRAYGRTGLSTAAPIPSLPGSFSSYAGPETTSRDFWVSLRYDFQAGTAAVPIGRGGRPGAGAGSIAGIVFLDENANGRLDALEARAAHVNVTLDGRYTTRTDAQGRFEFPFVAAGPHAVSLAVDSLPLPWAMPGADTIKIDVGPRETRHLELGVTRDRFGVKAE